jgi:TPR repeat protein
MMHQLGMMYWKGNNDMNTKIDIDNTVKLFQCAAELGSALAHGA